MVFEREKHNCPTFLEEMRFVFIYRCSPFKKKNEGWNKMKQFSIHFE